MKTCKQNLFLLLVLGLSLSLVACGGSSKKDDNDTDTDGDTTVEEDGDDNGTCTVGTTKDKICAANKEGLGDTYSDGVANGVPGGFPAAPDSMTLCGTNDTGMGVQVIYAVAAEEKEAVLSYYETELAAAGYAVDARDVDSACTTSISFSKDTVYGAISFMGAMSEVIITLL